MQFTYINVQCTVVSYGNSNVSFVSNVIEFYVYCGGHTLHTVWMKNKMDNILITSSIILLLTSKREFTLLT